MSFVNSVSKEEFCCFHNSFDTKIKHDFFSSCSWWSLLFENMFDLLNIVQEINKTWILLILKSSLNFSVAISQEHYTLLFTRLIIILFDLVKFLFHLFLEVVQEFVFVISNSYFCEIDKSLFLGIVEEIFKLLVIEWTTFLNIIGELFDKYIVRVVSSLQAFIFTNVSPG